MTQDNLFWGNHLRYFGDKISLDERLVLSRSFRAKITKSTTAITSIVIRALHESKKKLNQKSLLKFLLLFACPKSRISLLVRHCEANLRFAKAIQKIIQPNLARFVVQKIGSKDAVVPSADFLLEKDLRGTPPKSEKAAAFWRVWGAGRGVQPFLQKEKCESKSKKIVGDSRIAKMDSSLRTSCYAQNDGILDCHESANAESRNNEKQHKLRKSHIKY